MKHLLCFANLHDITTQSIRERATALGLSICSTHIRKVRSVDPIGLESWYRVAGRWTRLAEFALPRLMSSPKASAMTLRPEHYLFSTLVTDL